MVQTEKFDNNILSSPLKKELPDQLEYTYLFRVDDREYFSVNEELPAESLPDGYSGVTERSLRKEEIGLVKWSSRLRRESICLIGTEITVFAEDAARR